MWRPNNTQWWILTAVAVFAVLAWPPQEGKSLAIKIVNWAVDPSDRLPVLPPQLPLGMGDDPEAVEAHDLQVQHYDILFMKGGWTRKRLELKVAEDPFDPTTTRQILVGILVVTGLIAWRFGSTRT